MIVIVAIENCMQHLLGNDTPSKYLKDGVQTA